MSSTSKGVLRASRESDADAEPSADLVAMFWRYRWAVVLPAIIGLAIGFWNYSRTPEVFRSTTRLMLESDRPAMVDAITGDLLGGVPSVEIVRSQLFSDEVLKMAYDDERLKPFRETFGNNKQAFVAMARGALTLTPEVADQRSGQSLVMLLHFQHQNQDLCEVAVKAFSKSLQDFFNKRQDDSRGELEEFIANAMNHLQPAIGEAEQRYREFRRTAPLAWDAEGNAINPHRERQLFLVARKSELTESMREKSIQLASIESIAKETKDPMVALKIIEQLMDVSFSLPEERVIAQDLRETDERLQQLALDEQLVPLMIRRNNFAREFGDNHPTVKQLDTELELMKSELKRIVKEQAERIVELMKQRQAKNRVVDPATRAREAIQTIIIAERAELAQLKEQIRELDTQISAENEGAIRLANYEQDNLGMLREIERNRELMDQFEEKMARLDLTQDSGGTRVVELSAPVRGARIGPSLNRSLGMGGFVGLVLGAMLALLLEKNANTFRDADEVSAALRTPVLTHIPFFKAKIKKSQKGETNPYESLDPGLAVVHTPASVASEAIRSCRTSLFFEMGRLEGGKVLQVTSPLPGDGKSTIVGNLACSIAQSGKRVLAIDCDLRRPQLSENFALSDKLGLTNVLNGECEPQDACHTTPLPSLDVMASGPVPANPAEALTLSEMSDLLELLKERYDYIIIDTPPLLVVTDPSITAGLADGVLLALRIRRKSKPNAKEAMNILRAVGANILGVVINNSDESGATDGYRGYGYYRYGRYTSRYQRGSKANSGGKKEKSSSGSSPVVVSGRGVTPRLNGPEANEEVGDRLG